MTDIKAEVMEEWLLNNGCSIIYYKSLKTQLYNCRLEFKQDSHIMSIAKIACIKDDVLFLVYDWAKQHIKEGDKE